MRLNLFLKKMQKTGGNKMKLLGYLFLGIAGWACFRAGLRFDMWEFWAILTGFIVGCDLVQEGERKE